MEAVTVNRLYEVVKEAIADGLGDKKILIPSDDEGNDYRVMYFDFTVDPEEVRSCVESSSALIKEPLDEFVILG